jgi:hypothetical protein
MSEASLRVLRCPAQDCARQYEVSDEDPDSTLDDVLRHLRQHHLMWGDEALVALSRVDVTTTAKGRNEVTDA